MRAVLVLVVLLGVYVHHIDAALLEESKERQLNFYQGQVRITSELLISEECSVYTEHHRQEIGNVTADIHELKRLSDQLLKMLIQCRSEKSANNIEQTTQKPTTPTTANATKPPTIKLQPIECRNAVNYTESWRRDHLRSNFKPKGPHSRNGYACDLGVTSNFWFRFKGEAGNRMLNKCPKYRSCGAQNPLWTDRTMPQVVGVETNLKVYAVGKKKCKALTKTIKAMRCSWDTDYDLIFKQTTNLKGVCFNSFCGMI